jgi:uncharacterized membrane protein
VRSCRRHVTAAVSRRLNTTARGLDDQGEDPLTIFTPARGWFSGSAFGPGVTGTVASLGAVVAGAAIVEAALIPGLLIGGAAVFEPRLFPRDLLSGLGIDCGEPCRFRRRSADGASGGSEVLRGTCVLRSVARGRQDHHLPGDGHDGDFGANYFVIGELATAAGLSSLSLVAGPIAYFAHEAAWHYYGPASARHRNPLQAAVHLPIPGAAGGGDNGRTPFASLKVSRALAKTVTYEGVTGVSEFSVNYLFVRDLASAAGLTAFSIVIAPIVYYVHEKLWDYYDATKARSPAAAVPKLLPAA